MNTALGKAHRLLAPRVAYLIGTRESGGTQNIIPVSNLTSISTDPQQIVIAISKKWDTHKNLQDAEGFTVSVPHARQLEGVWKLGAKYSRYPYADNTEKIDSSALAVNYEISCHGPILTDGIGWMDCKTLAKLDFGGDHGIFVGQIEEVHFNPRFLNSDGTPRDDANPVMQITGNMFTADVNTRSIPYYPQNSDDK